jgi:choline dehydrogenase-like flavoprotein
MPYDFDVIVIGSGAGGATFAYACARAGKRVLLLERGQRYVTNGQPHNEQDTLIDKKPYSDQPVNINGERRRPYVGGGLGGSTALFGAALLRPCPGDFHPGQSYGKRLPRAVWDWPIDYEELEPHYTQAETLFAVAGCGADDFGPLGKPRQGFPGEALPLRPINRRLMAANRAFGLRPFRLPLAIDARRCLQCGDCAGYLCPTGARRSAAQLVDGDTGVNGLLQTMVNVEARSFHRDGAGRVDAVHVLDRPTGRAALYRAHRYALAGGAIGSPLLLLRSGINGPLIGRHYMFHLSPIVAGLFPQRTGGEETFIKQVGFADYYFGARHYHHKLGLIQSLPVPGPLMTAKAGGQQLPRALIRLLRGRMLPLAGIVEDLPNPANQVSLAPDGSAQLQHTFGEYDIERGRKLCRLMKQILKRAGALFCLSRPFPSGEHLAHQCGTLRMGTSPAHAVVDPDCRLIGHANVFVVDGSIFPTSLGVGPALTIIANALRVARLVTAEV